MRLIKKILLNNIWLKLLALLLAFVTWFYIEEAAKTDSERMVLQRLFLSSHYISKKLCVKPIFVDNVPEGYEFFQKNVKITPEYIVVMGPSRILSEKEYIYTKPIDLSEHTKSKTLSVELESISPKISFDKTEVGQVYIPIEKQAK